MHPHASLLPGSQRHGVPGRQQIPRPLGHGRGSLICSRLCSPPGRFPAAIGSGTHLPCHACLGRNDGYQAGPQEMDSSWMPGTVRDLQGTVLDLQAARHPGIYCTPCQVMRGGLRWLSHPGRYRWTVKSHGVGRKAFSPRGTGETTPRSGTTSAPMSCSWTTYAAARRTDQAGYVDRFQPTLEAFEDMQGEPFLS